MGTELDGTTIEGLLAELTEAVAKINEALKSDAPGHRKTYLKGAAREVVRTLGKE